MKFLYRKIRKVIFQVLLILYRKYNELSIQFFSKSCKKINNNGWQITDNADLLDFINFVKEYRHVTYSFVEEAIPLPLETIHKYVGAQNVNGNIIFIPSDEQYILKKCESYKMLGPCSSEGLFKWTGGCSYNNSVYSYPRTANSILKISENAVTEIPLSEKYSTEHHYSGVLLPSGVVYQPPRKSNHILKINLKDGSLKKIKIIDSFFKCVNRYCGSIYHPNGFIYLFPEHGRVIKLNPQNDEWCFIGKKVTTNLCFDAKIATDGNIYGYTAYGKGILFIDVYSDSVSVLFPEIDFGSYGTKFGINGKLYSVPGNGAKLYSFDPFTKELKVEFEFSQNEIEKYAGAATLQNGEIVCAPIRKNSVLKMIPNCTVNIPKNIYSMMYVDNY